MMNLTTISRTLRKNPTEAEKKLWHHIRRRQIGGFKFRRQMNIDNLYVVDFVCIEKKLIIEVDGGQHTEDSDKIRNEYLIKQGFEILRFWNNDILSNIDGALFVIETRLVGRNVPPTLILPREGGGY